MHTDPLTWYEWLLGIVAWFLGTLLLRSRRWR